MVLMDYIFAFSVLCLAGPIYRVLKRKLSFIISLMTAAVLCCIMRFIFHFLSGIIIWGTYAPEDQPVWLYSLLYNGSYMLFETLISGVILLLAGQKLFAVFMRKEL